MVLSGAAGLNILAGTAATLCPVAIGRLFPKTTPRGYTASCA
jgi:hypothetical protein